MSEWISVNERLPEHDFEDVLVCLHDKRKGLEDEFFVAEACLVRKRWSMTFPIDDNGCLDVVAWMPLPAFPVTSAPSSAASHDTPASAPD